VVSLPGILLNDMTCPRYTYSWTQSSVFPTATIGTAFLLRIIMTAVFLAFVLIPSALLTLCSSPSISSSSIPNFMNKTSQTINLMTPCQLFLGHSSSSFQLPKKCPPEGMSTVLVKLGCPVWLLSINWRFTVPYMFFLGLIVIDLAHKPGVLIWDALL